MVCPRVGSHILGEGINDNLEPRVPVDMRMNVVPGVPVDLERRRIVRGLGNPLTVVTVQVGLLDLHQQREDRAVTEELYPLGKPRYVSTSPRREGGGRGDQLV